MLKPIETYVLNAIIKFLGGGPDISGIAGENPPDAYVIRNGNKTALEITELSEMSYDEFGNANNRRTEDMFGINLCNRLNDQLGDIVPPQKTVFLNLHIPVTNPTKFKKGLASWLKHIIPSLDQNWNVSRICGRQVSAKLIENNGGKKIVGMIVNQAASADIGANAQRIIEDRIRMKEERFQKMNFVGVRWLGLYNDYWLANEQTYRLALEKLKLSHQFEKIFLVSHVGAVTQLYSNP